MSDQPQTRERSTLLARVVACVVLFIEFVALGVASATYLVYAAESEAAERSLPLAMGALAVIAAVALGAACVGVWRGRRWGVSLAVTWQALQAAVGVYVLTVAVTQGLVVIAVAVLGGAAALRSSRPT